MTVERATSKKKSRKSSSKKEPQLEERNYNLTQPAVIFTIMGIVIAIMLIWSFLPAPNLSIAVNGGNIKPIYNENKTLIIGLIPTFPAIITNTGNVQIHIVICEIR